MTSTSQPISSCCTAPNIIERFCTSCGAPDAAYVAHVRALNDTLRCGDFILGLMLASGRYVITAGIAEKGEPFIAHVLAAVRAFDAFTPDNDPHGEHDMAFLSVDGDTVFFKIDYYDLSLEGLSPDPSDAAVTRRVLTIGLASDY